MRDVDFGEASVGIPEKAELDIKNPTLWIIRGLKLCGASSEVATFIAEYANVGCMGDTTLRWWYMSFVRRVNELQNF